MMENISPFMIYLVMQLDTFIDCLELVATLSVVSIILCIVIGAFMISDGKEPWKEDKDMVETGKFLQRKLAKNLAILSTVFIILITVLPSSKTATFMIGIPTAIKIADDLELDETAKEGIKALNKLLEEYNTQEEN